MKIVKIISEHKKIKRTGSPNFSYPKPGMKRVMAVVEDRGRTFTRHLDVPKN